MASFLVLFNKAKEYLGIKPVVEAGYEGHSAKEWNDSFDYWVDEILQYIETCHVVMDLTQYGVDTTQRNPHTRCPKGMSEESWAKVTEWSDKSSTVYGLFLRNFCNYDPVRS